MLAVELFEVLRICLGRTSSMSPHVPLGLCSPTLVPLSSSFSAAICGKSQCPQFPVDCICVRKLAVARSVTHRIFKGRDRSLNGELTQRELDALRLLAREFSTRQMAQSLYVAPSTVRTQVKSIYRKLGVSSRKEAVEEAHARGLI